MENVDDFSDDRLKGVCIHCGADIALTQANQDHCPSRVLLDKPRPSWIPEMTVCEECNSSFSRDEEYFAAFLGVVLAGTTDPQKQVIKGAARILGSNAAFVRRIERAKRIYQTLGGEERIDWTPEEGPVRNVIVKNARGHVFFELSETVYEPARVWFGPLEFLSPSQREEFEDVRWPDYWPEVGTRMMTRVASGVDTDGSGWVIVQDNVYRYGVTQRDGGTLVRIVMREYLGAEVFWEDA